MNQPPKVTSKRIGGHQITVVETREPGVRCQTLSHEGKALGQVRSIRGSDTVTYQLSDGTLSGYKLVGAGGKTKEKLFTELRREIVTATMEGKTDGA